MNLDMAGYRPPGRPAIVQHRLLPDRIHVIVKYSDHRVQKWNLLSGTMVHDFGRTELDAAASG
jgi:hypothetical protein